MTAYQARWIVRLDGHPPLDGGIVVVDGGVIREVTSSRRIRPDVDLGDVVVLPGLINVHTHLDLTHAHLCRAKIGNRPQAFVDWLEEVVAFRQRQTPEQRKSAVEEGLAACLRAGVTTVGDILTDPHIWPVLTASPLQGVAWYELIGLNAHRAAATAAAADSWLANPDHGRWQRGLSPHAPYSVRRELFATACQLAATRGCPLAIHLAEVSDEERLLRQHDGPLQLFLQRLGAWDDTGLTESWDELLRSVPSSLPCLWIHANYLQPRPLPPTQTVVHCPRTHAAFGHPPFPLEHWRQCDVRLCLATDSLASNPDLDLLAEARHVYRIFPDLPAEQILAMITCNAAAALGRSKHLGTLTPGKVANLTVVPLPHGQPKDADPHCLVLESGLAVTRVMIKGVWHFSAQ